MGLGKLAGGASCHQSMDGAAFVSLHYERWRSPADRRVGLNADGGAALPARPPPSSRLLGGVALVTRRIMGAFHLQRINMHYPSQPPLRCNYFGPERYGGEAGKVRLAGSGGGVKK